jgi:hypothetical protein
LVSLILFAVLTVIGINVPLPLPAAAGPGHRGPAGIWADTSKAARWGSHTAHSGPASPGLIPSKSKKGSNRSTVRTVIIPPILRSGTKAKVGLQRSGPIATHRSILGVSCWSSCSG